MSAPQDQFPSREPLSTELGPSTGCATSIGCLGWVFLVSAVAASFGWILVERGLPGGPSTETRYTSQEILPVVLFGFGFILVSRYAKRKARHEWATRGREPQRVRPAGLPAREPAWSGGLINGPWRPEDLAPSGVPSAQTTIRRRWDSFEPLLAGDTLLYLAQGTPLTRGPFGFVAITPNKLVANVGSVRIIDRDDIERVYRAEDQSIHVVSATEQFAFRLVAASWEELSRILNSQANPG